MKTSRLFGQRLKEKPSSAQHAAHEFILRGGYARMNESGSAPSRLPALIKMQDKLRSEISNQFAGHGFLRVQVSSNISRMLELVLNETNSPKNLPVNIFSWNIEESDIGLLPNDNVALKLSSLSIQNSGSAVSEEKHSNDTEMFLERDSNLLNILNIPGLNITSDVLSLSYLPGKGSTHLITSSIPEIIQSKSDSDTQNLNSCTVKVNKCSSCGFKHELDTLPFYKKGKDRFSEKKNLPEKSDDNYNDDQKAVHKKIHTPETSTIDSLCEYLNISKDKTAKAVLFENDQKGRAVIAMIRGDLNINLKKLIHYIGCEPVPACEKTIYSIGCVPGFASPINIKKRKCIVLIDHSLYEGISSNSDGFVTGANQKDFHIENFLPHRDLPHIKPVDIADLSENTACPVCENDMETREELLLGHYSVFHPELHHENVMKSNNLMAQYLSINFDMVTNAIILHNHDRFGPVWPIDYAPWLIHIICLNTSQKDILDKAEMLHDSLEAEGIDVLMDDRGERPGVQFADSDLLGIPYRIIISSKTLSQNSVELKTRGQKKGELITLDEAIVFIKKKCFQNNNLR